MTQFNTLLTKPCNQSQNQKLKYNYHPDNSFYIDQHVYGSVTPVLHLLQDKKDLVIAEIGVFEGDSTLSMFEYLDIKKAYLIDPYDAVIANNINTRDGINSKLHNSLFEQTKDRLSKYSDKIVWLRGMSELMYTEIADNELDFIFIDGGHTYDAVYKDLILYYQKVKMGGVIAGDDFSNRFRSDNFGVIEAVNDVLSKLGYSEIDVHRHTYKPADYFSTFSFIKTIETSI